MDEIQHRTAPEEDPLLANRNRSSRMLPLAGSAIHSGWMTRANGDEEAWMNEWKKFLGHWLDTEPEYQFSQQVVADLLEKISFKTLQF